MFVTEDTDLLAAFLTARDNYELSAPGSEQESRYLSEMEARGVELAAKERSARAKKLAEDRFKVAAAAGRPYEDLIAQRRSRHVVLMSKAASDAGRARELKYFHATVDKLTERRDRAISRAEANFDKLTSQ